MAKSDAYELKWYKNLGKKMGLPVFRIAKKRDKKGGKCVCPAGVKA